MVLTERVPSRFFPGSLLQASAAASEMAAAAQEQASRAAAAAAEQAAKVQSSDAFAYASNTFAELRANTIAAAESAEGNIRSFYLNDDERRKAAAVEEMTPDAFGVTPEFVDFIRGLTPETFVQYPKPSLDAAWQMTQWQEVHARMTLKWVPEVNDFRYVLVPKHLDDDQFWQVYFIICMPRLEALIAEAEAREEEEMARRMAALSAADAVARDEQNAAASLRARTPERDEDGIEGAAGRTPMRDCDDDAGEVTALVPVSPGTLCPGDAATALAAEWGVDDDEDDGSAARRRLGEGSGTGHSVPGIIPGTGDDAAGGEDGDDLEAYIKDMLAGSGDDGEGGGGDDDEGGNSGDGSGDDTSIDLNALLQEVSDDEDVAADGDDEGSKPPRPSMTLKFSGSTSDTSMLEELNLKSAPESGVTSDQSGGEEGTNGESSDGNEPASPEKAHDTAEKDEANDAAVIETAKAAAAESSARGSGGAGGKKRKGKRGKK